MTVFAGEGYPSSEVMLRDVNAYLIRHGARPLERVRKTPCGKPVCDNAHLSITHTGTKILIAVASCGVGIDTERSDRPVRIAGMGIAEWTAYEAYVKLRGDGIKLSEIRGGVKIPEVRYMRIYDGYTTAVCGGDGNCEVVYLQNVDSSPRVY